MSRHYATTTKGQSMVFGYDEPLKEYFADVFIDDEEEEELESISSHGICAGNLTHASNSDIYEWIKERMDPANFKKHKTLLDNILLDLKI